MTNDMVEFVSVCRISEDYNGRIWLTRIADINDQQPIGSLQIQSKHNLF